MLKNQKNTVVPTERFGRPGGWGFVVFLAALLLLPVSAAAKHPGKGHGHWKHGQEEHGHAEHRPGRDFLDRLPVDVVSIQLGDAQFYFSKGRFYRHHTSGYVAVAPPVGGRIAHLPPGIAKKLRKAGHGCYEYGGVYYRREGGVWVIVNLPSEPVDVVVEPEHPLRVRVSVGKLNVRSGPGRDHRVVTRVYRGEVLKVLERDSRWYYVKLPGGKRGWVMRKFTEPQHRDHARG